MSHGHRLEEVMKYNLRTVQLFVDAATQREKRHLRDLTVAMRHSQGIDSKLFKDFLASLEE